MCEKTMGLIDCVSLPCLCSHSEVFRKTVAFQNI